YAAFPVTSCSHYLNCMALGTLSPTPRFPLEFTMSINAPVMTESGRSLFLYSAKLLAKFPLLSCSRPARSRNVLTTRSFSVCCGTPQTFFSERASRGGATAVRLDHSRQKQNPDQLTC